MATIPRLKLRHSHANVWSVYPQSGAQAIATLFLRQPVEAGYVVRPYPGVKLSSSTLEAIRLCTKRFGKKPQPGDVLGPMGRFPIPVTDGKATIRNSEMETVFDATDRSKITLGARIPVGLSLPTRKAATSLLELDITPQALDLLSKLVGLGLYGVNVEEVAGRLLDRALEQFATQPVYSLKELEDGEEED